MPAVLVVLLATIALAACGSSPPEAPSTSIVRSVPASIACAVLPPAALYKIVNGEVTVAKAMPSGGWVAEQCAWHTPTSGFIVSVGTAASITAFGDRAAPDAKAKLAQFKQLASATGASVIPGIGDGAVRNANGIAAFKGGTYVQITNLGLTNDQLVKILELAVAHLP